MVGVPNFDYPTIVKKGLYPNSCGLPWKIGAISTVLRSPGKLMYFFRMSKFIRESKISERFGCIFLTYRGIITVNQYVARVYLFGLRIPICKWFITHVSLGYNPHVSCNQLVILLVATE